MVYVDDFTFTHIANAKLNTMYEAAYQLQDITRRMHQKLGLVDLHCSTDKNQVLANRKDYAQVIEHALSEWEYTITDTTKLPGVDFAAGYRCNFERGYAGSIAGSTVGRERRGGGVAVRHRHGAPGDQSRSSNLDAVRAG